MNYIKKGVLLFIATLGEEARKVGFNLLAKAREQGISADMDYLGKSLKAQMKTADRMKVKFVCILGEDELKNKSILLKNMKTGEQKNFPLDDLLNSLK